MNKITGKALSLVLSLALVVSSFSTALVSANTSHTVSGTLSDTDHDKIYVVSGQEKDSNQVITPDLENYIFGSKSDRTLETADHKVNDAKILSISHSSGDRLVKWYDANKDGYSNSVSADDNVGLKLRSSSVKGHEVLNILYKATYTDDDVDYTVKGSKTFDIYCYDEYQPVIGVIDNVGKDDYTSSGISSLANGAKKTVELTDDLAQRVVSHNVYKDSGEYNNLAVYVAVPKNVGTDNETTEIVWQPITTNPKSVNRADNGYTLKVSNDSAVDMQATTQDAGVAAKVTGSSSGSITFTASLNSTAKKVLASKAAVGSWYIGNKTLEDLLSTTKDVTAKVKIAKKIKVDDPNWTKLGKYSGSTYLAPSGTSIDSDTTSSDSIKAGKTIKVNGMEVNFDNSTDVGVTVTDKASVAKISGKVGSIDISSTSSVDAIDLDSPNGTTVVPNIKISDAKVGNISFDKDGKGDVNIDSTKANVGNISNADKVEITSGKVGNIDADDEVDIKGDDDTAATVTGDVKGKTVDIDSEDSKVTIGTVTASDDSAEITVNGTNVNIKGFDFDNRSSVALKLDDFQGKIPAPVKASKDGSGISTVNSDAKVEVVGDTDIDSVSLEDESTMTFDGKLNVTSVDGSGILAVGAGKMYIDGSVSSTTLKLTDPTFSKGTVAFTAASDCVEPDDFTGFGFTLAKTAGSKTDTFKVDTITFKGLAINKASDELAKGYSETFTAGSYPAGLTIPTGYTVQWSLEDANDQVFSLTTNTDGSATVKVIGYDDQFATENKATLQAQLVDANGDTNDDYTVGECALTALLVPNKNYTSDTNGTVNMKVGGSYQFKITSSDGSVPTFVIAGNGGAIVTATSKSGNDYFYKVTALKAGDYGVYVNGTTRTAVLHITSDATIDASAVTIKAGSTYQFKVTSSAKPTFGLGGGAAAVVSSSSNGNNYFFKVKAAGKAGDKVGVYVNGARVAVITVG